MIITKLCGGIGNQMFQYAAARRLSCIHNVPLKLDLNWFDSHSLELDRSYKLHVFNIHEDFASLKDINKLKEFTDDSKLTLKSRITARFLPHYKQTHIREKHFHFDPEILKLHQNIYLDGYWQSEKYFIDIENIIRQEFTIMTAPFSKTVIELADTVAACESVSIHIRRGDYVSHPVASKILGTSPLEYYHYSIEKLASFLNSPHFFVFSDDPGWARDNLKLTLPMMIVSNSKAQKDYEDLYLISQCKHHILANSSFSWWGAWLCQNQNKTVISPANWFRDTTIDTSTLIPDNWLRI